MRLRDIGVLRRIGGVTMTRLAGRIALLLAAAAIGTGLGTGAARGADPVAHASIGFQPTPLALATDAAGHVLLSNPQTSRQVKEYSADGTLLRSFGSLEHETRAIATDAAGDVWVADLVARKVSELGSSGAVLRSWDAEGLGIAVAPDGDIYTVGPKGVARYSPAGQPAPGWSLGVGAGQAWGIAVGPDGLIYVADTYSDRVDVFDADGVPVRDWTTAATPGYSALPYGIAVAPTGDVYLADTEADRVEEFTATGTPVRTWGTSGNGPGRFDTPTGIAVGPEGDVYVADEAAEYPGSGTARVQKFTAEGQFLTEWGYIPKPPPEPPRLGARPGRKTAKSSAVLSFTSAEKRAGFRCRLRGASVPASLEAHWRVCTSPVRYRHLRPGSKTFEVRAVVGSRSSRVTRYAWTVLPAG